MSTVPVCDPRRGGTRTGTVPATGAVTGTATGAGTGTSAATGTGTSAASGTGANARPEPSPAPH